MTTAEDWVKIQIDGAGKLRRQLKQAQDGISNLKAAHRELGELVGEQAARLVPVRSGLLKSTIRASGQASGAIVRAGYARVPYAGAIHFGWPARRIAPTPFLYAALDLRRDEVIAMYEDRVKDLIKRHDLA